jgi:CRISPR/Cas system CSM-associated protein Csm4 (group 5 of RAMP superfamily)
LIVCESYKEDPQTFVENVIDVRDKLVYISNDTLVPKYQLRIDREIKKQALKRPTKKSTRYNQQNRMQSPAWNISAGLVFSKTA